MKRYEQIIQLRDAGRSWDEIAAAMSITWQTARSIYSRHHKPENYAKFRARQRLFMPEKVNRGVNENMSWNDERVETLKRLAADGQSASYIAAAIGGGITRNAVIGKAHRLDVQIGRTKIIAPAQRLAQRVSARRVVRIARERRVRLGQIKATIENIGHSRALQQAAHARAVAVVDAVPPQALMVSLLDLEPHHCRWPIGEVGKPGFGFCGCQKAPVGSYCQHHQQLSRREPLSAAHPNAVIERVIKAA